jgi:hypothetical protein|tara:strand:+ start:721 stop:1290 length:570 start_codon:yes stop_codon:yes gene_type:complete
VNEINILENQLKRMRSMNKFYHLEFLKDVRYFFAISIISLIISFNNQNVLYLLPLISLFGSVMLAFHAYFLIFSRNYSEYLEKKINKQSNSEIFITHKLENSYFFPIQDKKIVVAKIGKEFSWFSFVTLFITFYGVALYVYAVYNLVTLMNSINYLVFIIILTLITFSVGYWWFVNNVGESRLRSIYDE